jgi:Flp pilus assembly protein CpaB
MDRDHLELRRAVDHPLRCQILLRLETKPSSAAQLAEHFDRSVPVVLYHLRVLADMQATQRLSGSDEDVGRVLRLESTRRVRRLLHRARRDEGLYA